VTSYRAWPSTSGPVSSTSSPNTLVGVLFKVTARVWLEGVHIWVADANQSSASRQFALWQVTGSSAGTFVKGAVAASPTLNTGAWTFCPFDSPIPLMPNITYKLVVAGPTGFVAAGPSSYFASGAGAAGITNGPLTLFSSTSPGTNVDPNGAPQMTNSATQSDPTTHFPTSSSANSYWIDPQVTDTPPTGASYRIFPSNPTPKSATLNSQTLQYTKGLEVSLSSFCKGNRVWFYSPPGATALPTRTTVWRESDQHVMFDNSSASWSDVAGSGWVSSSTGDVDLTAGNYAVGVWYGGGSQWFTAVGSYWTGSGDGASGLTNGPISAPSDAASTHGQAPAISGSYAFLSGVTNAGENYYVDFEVTPAVQPTQNALLALGII
jgi:hypothetical protein